MSHYSRRYLKLHISCCCCCCCCSTAALRFAPHEAYHEMESLLIDNELTMLSESFGSLKVGGDLWLSNNQLTMLSESFGSLTVGGDLLS